ncbi:TonB-dependent receptor [Granulicella sp. dw_53]|uniref:TonB-dependent receptor n=1 Tax=Granulicella sp. dw_53 TaxID=2719792 RepID=UPI001BD2C0D0|nr:TonB-dependent receptor [Granulicella sp. dw_53]
MHKLSGGLFRKTLSTLALLTLSLFPSTLTQAFAQSAGTASVQGSVTDATGALLPNATVTFTNTATGATRIIVTDGSGLYSLPNVSVGPYSLTVTAAGFRGYTQRGQLEVGNSIEINASLTVGSATDQQIEVQATGTALDTENSTFKQVIDQRRITELPLNGRQATQLILVSGGSVNAPANDIIGSKTYANTPVIAVAGSQGIYNNYVLDGASHTDTFTNVNLPYPFPDALREFSVESNSLPARNGLHPGSLVNVVTNSGTNQWHGTVFDFVRNNVVNATNFFSTSKDTVKRNQFGGTFGGKLITDKLFFFGGYQGTREHKTSSATGYCIPTAAELNGDFSQMGTKATSNCAPNATNIVDPVTGADISATRKLPASSISPQAIALAKMLPLSQADQFGRVNVALPANNKEDQYIGRIDYTVSQKHTIFGRYFLTNYNAPAYFSPTNLLLTTVAGNDERVQTFTLGDTYLITPKLVNTFHGTYARRRNNRGPTAGGINANTIGVNMFTYVPNDLRLTITNGFSVGCGTCSPGFFNTNTEHFADDIDYIRGKHQIAFGGEILRTGDNTQAGYLQNGSFNFGGLASGVNGAAGEPMVDFIAGRMSTIGTSTGFSQSKAQQTAYRQTSFGLYAQDTYHLSQKVTINLGLRWEPELYPVDNFHRGSSFSQAAFIAGQRSSVYLNAPAGSTYFGDPGVPKSFTDNRLANLSPRGAVTIDPFGNGKTVFRLGGAMMYDNPALYTSQRTSSNPPYTNEIDVTGVTSLANPWSTYTGGNPFPIANPPQSTSPFPTNTLYVLIPRHIQTPTVNQWTASVQQDLGRGWNMSITYLGNKNSHLWLGKAINPAVYIPGTWRGPGTCGALAVAPTTATNLTGVGNPCSSVANSNDRTVLSLINHAQGIGYSPTMTQIDDGANSSYNGLLALIQHRMSNNFSFLANYTWSHCISTGDSPGDVAAPTYENSANPRLDRANCGYDVRHIFNTTFVASTHFSSLHGVAGALANNWQIAPIIRILSGTPLNVTSGIDNSLTGIGLDRPNLASPNAVYSGTKITQKAAGNLAYINKAAFTQNAPGTYGNLGRNAFRGPNYYNLDAALSRAFPLRERLAFNLRLEAFNVLNHPNLTTFTTALNSGTFGNATAAADPRIFQLAGKFTF